MDIVATLTTADLTELGIQDLTAQHRILEAAPNTVPNRSKVLLKNDCIQTPSCCSKQLRQATLSLMPSKPNRTHIKVRNQIAGRARDWERRAVAQSFKRCQETQSTDFQPGNEQGPVVRPLCNLQSRQRTWNAAGATMPPPLRTLWASAQRCEACAGPRIADRLANNRPDDAQTDQLNRGGQVFVQPAAEPRGAKLVRLEALRTELAHHRATVEELQRHVSALERELASEVNTGV